MCWFIEVRLIGEATARKPRVASLRGDFPNYVYVGEEQCSCGAVVDGGSAVVEDVGDTIAHCLRDRGMDRVEVTWYWNRAPNRPRQVEISLNEFRAGNARLELESGVRYSISSVRDEVFEP